eukprot:Sspe_Gene.11685::Locus_3962_Transcript_1_1_Confidence_1.000_Length_2100::g.11685::m.11685
MDPQQLILLLLAMVMWSRGAPMDCGNPFTPHTCDTWCNPMNANEYPAWPFCNRRPGESKHAYMENSMSVLDQPAHQCSNGKVLRSDADALICADYDNPTWGEAAAGPCTDATCCVLGQCNSFQCPSGMKLKPNPEMIDCVFPCTKDKCCDPEASVPRHNAQGMIFVDQDPGRFRFGGKATILRAVDESDITHYRVYWGFSMMVRKAPSCAVNNPVSWHTGEKYIDPTKLLHEVPVTGADITFDIPMGTVPNERCPIAWDIKQRTTAGTDECNPHYLMVVSVNQNGEKAMVDLPQQLGPAHPISDYEYNDTACAEGGVTMGHDLPAEFDYVLNRTQSPSECARLCREYNKNPAVDGPPECRYYCWSSLTGGPNSGNCWIESQALQKSHYGVRTVGPAVCITPDNQPGTGRERPRCQRWIRQQNVAPFTNAWDFKNKGLHYAQFPQPAGDVPLGPFDHAEGCQALCDMDHLCIGFVFAKKVMYNRPQDPMLRNVGDDHRCILLHRDEGVRNPSPIYDMWLCSREEQAPFVLGFDLLRHPFGYRKCNPSTELESSTAEDYDCCASRCAGRDDCRSFTFWSDGSQQCVLYSDTECTARESFVDGCASESCYQGYGRATYRKQTPHYELVDRWPENGGTATGIPVRVQTNGLLPAGTKIACMAVLDYMLLNPPNYFTGGDAMPYPTTYEEMV